MGSSGDAAEQMVRFYLEGFEVVAKISGKGAEHTIALLLNIMKNKQPTKGKARLNTMIKSGKPLTIFTINRKDLPKFANKAKRYGVLYSVLMKKMDRNEDGLVDIMVKQDDASKVNRIVERFKLTTSNDTQIKTELTKSLDEKKNDTIEILTDKNNNKESQAETIDLNNAGSKNNSSNNKSELAKETRASVKDEILDIKINGNEPRETKDPKDNLRQIALNAEARERMQVLKSENINSENFNQAKTEQSPLSETYSKTSRIVDENRRKSIRMQLAEIQRDMDFKAGDETKKQVKSRGKHFEDKENKRGKHSKKKRKNKANTL